VINGYGFSTTAATNSISLNYGICTTGSPSTYGYNQITCSLGTKPSQSGDIRASISVNNIAAMPNNVRIATICALYMLVVVVVVVVLSVKS